jgi:membrane protein DedA with SNARE-associated domain
MPRSPRSLRQDPPGAPPRGRAHPAVLVAGATAAVVLILVATGVVRMPDLAGTLDRVSHTLGPWTYAVVAGMAFLETGAFIGLVAPGETALVLGGVVAAQGDVSLPLVLAVAWPAAVLGDLASYTLGRRLGRPFLMRRGSALGVTHARLRMLDGFLDRHGGKAILIGRFIGVVRAVAPFMAGAARLPLRRLLPWSLLGTAAWTSALTLTGYLFSSSFSAATGVLTHATLALAVLAALIVTLRSVRRVPAPA